MELKTKLRIIVFGTETRAGRLFDIVLLWVILLSIFLIMLESIPYLNTRYYNFFRISEWIITGLFTAEYLIRIWVSQNKKGYIFSFFGIVDLLSILPSYIGLLIFEYHTLIIFRAIRLLRVFRIFQLSHYLADSALMGRAMLASLRKIIIFLSVLIIVVMILGSIMYIVEGPGGDFNSIPQSIYWAIVTITTVGYGDVTPVTAFGKVVSSIIMLLGYAIIAVPTGIVTAEFARVSGKESEKKQKEKYCHHCGIEILHPNANYCRNCGKPLKMVNPTNT